MKKHTSKHPETTFRKPLIERKKCSIFQLKKIPHHGSVVDEEDTKKEKE
jgi:hypothetical protein